MCENKVQRILGRNSESKRGRKRIIRVQSGILPFTLYCWTDDICRDCLCGLVVRVPEVPSWIPGAKRFSEKQCVWNGVHSAS
jgi:hypothetical protein